MLSRHTLVMSAGAVFIALAGYVAASRSASDLSDRLTDEANAAISAQNVTGVESRFITDGGSPTRHARLIGGGNLNLDTRDAVAKAVAAVPGVGGVVWVTPPQNTSSSEPVFEPLHCQEDVEGLLRTRSVRFQEGSSALLPISNLLLDEVADALRPCLGSIIAVTGHTDDSGNEAGNIALSMDRARAVREALVARGIPRDGLRARGVGSREPVEGLASSDPANRRIEFSVIATEPLHPTPVDTPGAR